MSQGCTIWLTGLSGAGKSTIAERLAAELRDRGSLVEVLDGDVVRTHLSKGLSFSKEDRDTNILRIGWICEVLTRNGIIAIAAAISPYRSVREEVRRRIDPFVEVFVDCSLEGCIQRDVKGLYRKALSGEIASFTGVSDPYEPPTNPEITIHTENEAVHSSVAGIVEYLEGRGILALTSPQTVGAEEHNH
ncbi:MAG: adenylyl-sulfate kinase [Herpetosiphon sp.]